MRLEVFPPVGGSRLVVIADGRRLLALDPVNRRVEAWDSQREGLTRLIGASLDAADLRTLLEGRSPCADGPVPAPSDGSCPFGGGRYRPDPATGAGTDAVPGAVLLDATGATVLALEFPPPAPAPGEWRQSLILRRPRDASTIRLTRDSGPRPAILDPALLSTEPPRGFDPGSVLGDGALSGIASGASGDEP